MKHEINGQDSMNSTLGAFILFTQEKGQIRGNINTGNACLTLFSCLKLTGGVLIADFCAWKRFSTNATMKKMSSSLLLNNEQTSRLLFSSLMYDTTKRPVSLQS